MLAGVELSRGSMVPSALLREIEVHLHSGNHSNITNTEELWREQATNTD